MSRSVRCSIGTLNDFRSSFESGTHTGCSSAITSSATTITPTTMKALVIGSTRVSSDVRDGDEHRAARRVAGAVGRRDVDRIHRPLAPPARSALNSPYGQGMPETLHVAARL